MEAILMTVACFALVAVYVAWCRRKDRLADREHQAVITAMSPGPRIRELTLVRPNPLRARKLASGSHPVDFGHTPTDYGTYTPAQIDAAILGRADYVTPFAEAPAHDACSTGGSDGGGHHRH